MTRTYRVRMLEAKGHYIITFDTGIEKETGAIYIVNWYICLQ